MITIDIKGLGELDFWRDWQRVVAASLPNFCADALYVEQKTQTQADFDRVADFVCEHGQVDRDGKTRDAEFGGIVRNTRALGNVTRMWIDSNVEVDFVRRNLGFLSDLSVLDVGAGYGRLAASMRPLVCRYCCVDPVPISTIVSRFYLAKHRPSVEVFSMDEFAEEAPEIAIDLAVNVHSWSECSIPEVSRWVSALHDLEIPWLFTVSHGTLDAKVEPAYVPRGGRGTFRPEIERFFELSAEESIGLSNHPHALWHRRSTPALK
jgi:SAM-dependent methyltransferase